MSESRSIITGSWNVYLSKVGWKVSNCSSHAPTGVNPNTHCSAASQSWWCDALSVLGASLMIIKLYLFVILTTISWLLLELSFPIFFCLNCPFVLIIFLLCCAFLFDIHIFWTNPLRMMYIASVFSSSHWLSFLFSFF